MSIPLQSAANMKNPREHVAWALVGLAGPNSHAPLIVPKMVMSNWSEQLYDAGFRHHPEHQKIKYIPPSPGVNWVSGAAGQWVDINKPLPPEQSAPDISHLSDEEKRVLLRRITTDLRPSMPPERGDQAGVTND